MLPRWHIFWGAVFSALFWILFPETAWFNAAILFLSAFLIDFDHYIVAVYNTGKLGLFNSFRYYEMVGKQEKKEFARGIHKRGDFVVFHTVEFHLLVLLFGIFVWNLFIYVFIGMLFHSILDIIDMMHKKRLYRREFLLTRWILQRL
ncbi:MAG: hypothetical protein MUF61_00585 [archaeon]|jgi:hypothetical protein|nr:hypothetical protein [archaeon]